MSWRKLVLTIALVLSLAGIFHAQSGVTFWFAASDRNGGVWIGGSVFDIEGLLLNSKPRRLIPLRLRSVSFVEDASFVNARVGWAVGSGFLYHTKNAGRHWDKVQLRLGAQRLSSVCFLNPRQGWIAGQGGLVLFTADGGLTWRQQESSTTFSLQKIRFIDPDNGWAMGSDIGPPETRRILLLTKDGGQTWKKAPESDTQQFVSVTFLNSHSAWAINNGDEILQTLDGGLTWVVRRSSDGTFLNALFFINESTGWAVGNGIIKTTDAGTTWRSQIRTTGVNLDSLDHVIFADELNGWAIGLTQVITTDDGGTVWKPMSDSWKAEVISNVRRERFKTSIPN